MAKTDDELISQTEAAELTGKSLAAINMLVRRGTLRHIEKYGLRLVYRSEVNRLISGNKIQKAKGQHKRKAS